MIKALVGPLEVDAAVDAASAAWPGDLTIFSLIVH
jgi:hypothetical protein